MRKTLLTHKISADVIQNVIDDFSFIPLTSRKKVPFTFVIVGRLEMGKGHLNLLKACLLLKQFHFRLRIIGSGSMKKTLLSFVRSHRLLDKVDLLGPKNKSEIIEELQVADAFVFPSDHESFGVAALEAQACGLPIIGTNVGEVGNMITSETGILLKDTQAETIAKAMEEMIENQTNFTPEKIRSFYLKNYSSKIALERLRAIYLETL